MILSPLHSLKTYRGQFEFPAIYNFENIFIHQSFYTHILCFSILILLRFTLTFVLSQPASSHLNSFGFHMTIQSWLPPWLFGSPFAQGPYWELFWGYNYMNRLNCLGKFMSGLFLVVFCVRRLCLKKNVLRCQATNYKTMQKDL